MIRTYQHHGLTVEVSVATDFAFGPVDRPRARSRYAAIVSVSRRGRLIATFSPLRFAITGGRPFDTEVEALMGGYSAARQIVDNLFEDAGLSDDDSA
jgi:hypothetical protein